MPQRDDDLFTRLRRAGVRKPVAKKLSELSADAGNKAIAAGRRAVAELRMLADEIEKRLPPAPSGSLTSAKPGPVTPKRRQVAPTATAQSKTTASTARSRATAARTSKTAPRGENKAKILAALTAGPRTASEIGKETGIATPTVSAALTRLSKAGDVTKAARGYTLPS
jgi:predicted Rossmann fold nucleotide-binding protein DprA/Smf involved in DNA uptake